MSFYYFDSSALVKRYLPEAGTKWIEQVFDPASGHILSNRSPPHENWGGYSGNRLGKGRGRVALATLCNHLGDVGPGRNTPLPACVDDAGQ